MTMDATTAADAPADGPVEGPVELCVLLWARPGHDDDLVAYEDRVLTLVPAHGGSVLQRARTDKSHDHGTVDHPTEVQFYRFPSESALQAYLADDRRVALAAERVRVIARTEQLRVTFS